MKYYGRKIVNKKVDPTLFIAYLIYMITIKDISEKFKIQKGCHKGKLNQGALQCKGKFLFRDPHPKVKGLYFLAFNKAQKFPQRWALESSMPKALEVKPPEGIPEEFIVTCNRGRQGAKIGTLDQDALQIEGEFSAGDKHPKCDLIVFHGNRENSGKTRWQTLQQYEKSLEHSKAQAKIRRANRTPEQIEEDKIKQKIYGKKFWSDPVLSARERAKRKERYANRTPEQIAHKKATDRAYRKNNIEKVKANRKRDYENNKERYINSASKWNIDNREQRNENNREISKAQREQSTIALNEFYRSNKIPKYLWHKEEFGSEKDLHKALEHIIVKKYGLNIIHEMHTEHGRPDIYIKELNLNIEVKLHSEIWREEKVAEQKARYEKIAETIVVSLDGKPEGWVTPKELFQLIESRI